MLGVSYVADLPVPHTAHTTLSESAFMPSGLNMVRSCSAPITSAAPVIRSSPVIIPKGSRIWFGANADIASDTMILYRNIEEASMGRVLVAADQTLHKFAPLS